MTGARFDPQRSRIEVGSWSVRVHELPTEGAITPPSVAVELRIRSGVNLVIEVTPGSPLVGVEAWAGEPYASDGLALITNHGGEPIGVTRIPLCSCGDRGCGNANVQLASDLPASALPALVQLIISLPDLAGPPERGRTWVGALSDLPETVRRAFAAP